MDPVALAFLAVGLPLAAAAVRLSATGLDVGAMLRRLGKGATDDVEVPSSPAVTRVRRMTSGAGRPPAARAVTGRRWTQTRRRAPHPQE